MSDKLIQLSQVEIRFSSEEDKQRFLSLRDSFESKVLVVKSVDTETRCLHIES